MYVDNMIDEKIFSLNENEKVYPGFFSKDNDSLCSKKNISNLDKVVSIYVNSYKKLIEFNSSMADFVEKEHLTYRDLLLGTILCSGGKCAKSLAISIFGSIDNCVNVMNNYMHLIKPKNTNYTNITVLDEYKQFCSAKDTAMMKI